MAKINRATTKKGGVHSSKRAPTPELYSQLQTAFDRFNAEFFKGKLPNVVMTFARKPRSLGYFWPNKWSQGKQSAHEIALNPDHMSSRGIKDALSTILHEQCHLWQCVHGKKYPKKPYHNAEFRDEMKRVGLITSATGAEGGKQTGQKMSHFVEKGGVFDKLSSQMVKEGFKFSWMGMLSLEAKKEKKGGKRVKYVCPDCEFAAWAKHDANVLCGGPEDDGHRKPVQMEAEAND